MKAYLLNAKIQCEIKDAKITIISDICIPVKPMTLRGALPSFKATRQPHHT